ncbi:MAG TPA: hypothetical protein VMW89_03485 [Desulfatiglandales bacterium]|nr:hypothetical protein [Desulfatiglandales bacterium]
MTHNGKFRIVRVRKRKFLSTKKSAGEEQPKAELDKLPRPKDLPQLVGQYLIVQLKMDPDWVWDLKAVVRKRPEGKSSYNLRVFDKYQATLRKVEVKDYTSLDGHPDLILYEGWFDKVTNRVQLEEKSVPASRAA